MDETLLRELLLATLPIARIAGQAIRQITLKKEDIVTKENGSPMTSADTVSHSTILLKLRSMEPAFPVISEEGNFEETSSTTPELFWLVDPLDGTKEFIKGYDDYTVNIALVEKTQPVLGIIYAPAIDTIFYAAKNLGAFKQVQRGQVELVNANRNKRANSMVVSRNHSSKETEEFIGRLGITDVRHRGSSIKFCDVAEGTAVLYPRFGPTWLWDTGAGTIIAREAGCDVVDLKGKPLDYDPAKSMKHFGFMVYPTEFKPFLS